MSREGIEGRVMVRLVSAPSAAAAGATSPQPVVNRVRRRGGVDLEAPQMVVWCAACRIARPVGQEDCVVVAGEPATQERWDAPVVRVVLADVPVRRGEGVGLAAGL